MGVTINLFPIINSKSSTEEKDYAGIVSLFYHPILLSRHTLLSEEDAIIKALPISALISKHISNHNEPDQSLLAAAPQPLVDQLTKSMTKKTKPGTAGCKLMTQALTLLGIPGDNNPVRNALVMQMLAVLLDTKIDGDYFSDYRSMSSLRAYLAFNLILDGWRQVLVDYQVSMQPKPKFFSRSKDMRPQAKADVENLFNNALNQVRLCIFTGLETAEAASEPAEILTGFPSLKPFKLEKFRDNKDENLATLKAVFDLMEPLNAYSSRHLSAPNPAWKALYHTMIRISAGHAPDMLLKMAECEVRLMAMHGELSRLLQRGEKRKYLPDSEFQQLVEDINTLMTIAKQPDLQPDAASSSTTACSSSSVTP